MAQKWVSFEEVKTRVSMQDVLAHYGLMQGAQEKPSKHGLELRLHCPFHDDKTPSLSINVETGKFHCFGCHAKGGDIFDFVVAKDGIAGEDRTKNRRRAALLIADWFGVASKTAPAQTPTAAAEMPAPVEILTPATDTPDEHANAPLKFTFQHLNSRHLYLTQERGLQEATIDFFGLGHHAGKGIMDPRAHLNRNRRFGNNSFVRNTLPGSLG